MEDFLKEITSTIGGRPAGSPEEKKAQEWINSDFQNKGINSRILPFYAPLKSKFGSLHFFSTIFVLVHGLFYFSPVLAFLFSLLNGLLFFLHFVLPFTILDFLFPKEESWNVEAKIPSNSKPRLNIFLTAHIDSVREFKWWFKLKKMGLFLSMWASLVFLLQPILFIATIYFHVPGLGFWLGLIFLPFVWVLFDFIDWDRPVEGAIDNLSGVAVARGVLNQFWDKDNQSSFLDNINLYMLSLGSEELGLRGSCDYVQSEMNEINKSETLIINIDSIKEPKFLTILEGEVFYRIKYSKKWIAKLEEVFKSQKLSYSKKWLGLGGTDGAVFRKAGFSTVSIVGMDTESLDETYHTRLDTLDNMDLNGVRELKEALGVFITELDESLSS